MEYELIDLGLTEYNQAYILQRRYLELVKSNVREGFLLFTEHEPVFTLGRSAGWKNLLIDEKTLQSYDIDVVQTDRGGDITFHGPGQLVVYIIIDLRRHYRDVHRYLRDIEETVILTLSTFGIAAFRIKERTGVWAKEGKLASIGIGVSRWVSYHGLAINANADLGYFKMIHPCGLKDITVTSIREIKGSITDPGLLKKKMADSFCAVFNCNVSSFLV